MGSAASFQRPSLPNRWTVGSGDSQSAAGSQNQLEIPGYEVEMSLSADFTPQDENGDEGYQIKGGVGEPEEGHRHLHLTLS